MELDLSIDCHIYCAWNRWAPHGYEEKGGNGAEQIVERERVVGEAGVSRGRVVWLTGCRRLSLTWEMQDEKKKIQVLGLYELFFGRLVFDRRCRRAIWRC